MPRHSQLASQSAGANCFDSSRFWSLTSKLDGGLWRGKPQEIDIESRLQNWIKTLKSFLIGHLLSRKADIHLLHYCTTFQASTQYWPQFRKAEVCAQGTQAPWTLCLEFCKAVFARQHSYSKLIFAGVLTQIWSTRGNSSWSTSWRGMGWQVLIACLSWKHPLGLHLRFTF